MTIDKGQCSYILPACRCKGGVVFRRICCRGLALIPRKVSWSNLLQTSEGRSASSQHVLIACCVVSRREEVVGYRCSGRSQFDRLEGRRGVEFC